MSFLSLSLEVLLLLAWSPQYVKLFLDADIVPKKKDEDEEDTSSTSITDTSEGGSASGGELTPTGHHLVSDYSSSNSDGDETGSLMSTSASSSYGSPLPYCFAAFPSVASCVHRISGRPYSSNSFRVHVDPRVHNQLIFLPAPRSSPPLRVENTDELLPKIISPQTPRNPSTNLLIFSNPSMKIPDLRPSMKMPMDEEITAKKPDLLELPMNEETIIELPELPTAKKPELPELPELPMNEETTMKTSKKKTTTKKRPQAQSLQTPKKKPRQKKHQPISSLFNAYEKDPSAFVKMICQMEFRHPQNIPELFEDLDDIAHRMVIEEYKEQFARCSELENDEQDGQLMRQFDL